MPINKSVQITLIIVVGIVILGLIGFATFNSLNISPENTIQVPGTATIEVMPDIIGIYFNIETQGATSKEASDKNSEIVDGLTDSLLSKGFEKEEVQTQSFSVYPEYDWMGGSGRIIRYRASHSIKIELAASESEKIGDIIDSGIDAGAGISYINFELSQENQNKYKAEAMKLAAQDATVKAKAVAEGLDKKLGPLVSVSINDYNYFPWIAMEASGRSSDEVKEVATNIQPSEQEITASVTAVYKIR